MGTTSACAENTPRGNCENSHRRNYLRVRGEYRVKIIYGTNGHGTTSACAENTVGFHWCGFPPWNYLRVRGEYIFRPPARPCGAELPPRARRIHVY